jgi:SSS family solute:Na+ symporter
VISVETFEVILWVFLGIYIAGMLGLSFILRKRATGLTGFLVAKRKLPVLFTSVSLAASILGASMTFIAVGKVYSYGLSGMWFTLGPAFFLLIMGIFIAKKVRETKALTLSDLIGKMFDTKTRIASAVLIVLAEIAWISLLAQTTQLMLVMFLGLPEGWAMFLALAFFTAYTLIAGKVADAYTDVVQFVLMLVLVGILVITALMKGGSDVTDLPVDSWKIVGGPISPIQIIAMFLLLGLSYLVGPDVYAAILSAKSEKTAQRSGMIGAGIILFWGIVMGILGMLGSVIVPGVAPEAAGSVIIRLIYVCVENDILRAVVVGGMIAVLMSSIDTTLLTGSSVLANDIIGPISSRFGFEGPRQRQLILYTAKGGVVWLAIFAFIVGLWIDNIIDTLTLAYTVFVSGMILPVLAGLFKEKTKVTSWGAFTGLAAGGGVSLVWLKIIEKGLLDLSPNDTALFLGLLACIMGIVTGTVLQRLLKKT